MHEVFLAQQLLQVLFLDEALLQHEVVDTLAGFRRLAADEVAVVVADHRVEVSDNPDGVGHVRLAHILVGGDAGYALLAQGLRRVGEQADGLEQRLTDHRLHHVELELPRLGGHGDGHVVAEDLEADLVDHLGDHRVDLRRHDRGARLALRQVDFVQTSARAGRQQAQVVADLRQLHRGALDSAVHHHVTAGVRGRLDQVRRRLDVQTGDLAQRGDHLVTVAARGVDAGADGGGTQVDLQQRVGRAADGALFLGEVGAEGGEFLAQGHRDGVLKLGAAHLDDVGELVALRTQRLLQLVELLQQPLHGVVHAEAESGRVRVISGLRHVDVVVRVDHRVVALVAADQFEREVGHHFVGVHVQRCARAALEDVDRELVHAHALVQDLVAGRDDGLGLVLGQGVQAAVSHRGGFLHLHHAANELRHVVDGASGDLEIVLGALGVDAVVDVGGDLGGAEEVFFSTSAHERHYT